MSDILADVLRADIDLEALPIETPETLRRLLRRCLEREPRGRLRHMGDALLELRDSEEGGQQTTKVLIPATTPRWMWIALVAAVAVALATAILHFGSTPDPQPIRRFDLAVDNVDANRNRIPSISPDGSKALWSSNGRLWVRDFGEFDSTELPETAGARVSILVSGRSLRRVCPRRSGLEGGGRWRRSGQSRFGAAAEHDRLRLRLLGHRREDPPAGSHLAGLLSLPEGGGEAVVYVPLDETAEADFHHVARLPGTDAVVVSVHGLQDLGFTLQVISDSGREVLSGGPGHIVGAPVYAPTGHLLFEQMGSGAGIWALPFSLERLEACGAPFLVIPEARMPSLGSDGTLLYARANYMDDRNIAWVTEGGGVETVLDDAKPYGFPALSPDQRKIAFQIGEPGGSAVWVHDLDRGTTTKLTNSGGINGAPLWMPDGERVLLTSDRSGGGWDLYLMPVDGSEEPVLVYDSQTYVWPTSVSADGRFVVIEELTPDNRGDLVRLDLEDGSIQVIVASPATEASGKLSPDNQWLAYHSDESGRAEVYLRPQATEATAAGRIQVSSGGGAYPVWSNRGDRLLYRQQNRIMAVDVEFDDSNMVLGQPEVVAAGVAEAIARFRVVGCI